MGFIQGFIRWLRLFGLDTALLDDDLGGRTESSTTGIGTGLDSGMDYPSTTFLGEVSRPASSSDQTTSPVWSLKQDVTAEMSGVGGGGRICWWWTGYVHQ